MKGYLQELDTVNFSTDNTPAGEMPGKLVKTKIKTAIYSIFYEIDLAPHQALDLLLLRNTDSVDSLSDLPFAFHTDGQRGSSTPFSDYLVQLLRRRGKDAFVFSSTSSSIWKSEQWGELVARDSSKLSADDLLSEASQDCFYPEIVAWAKRLDIDRAKLSIRHGYKQEHTFQGLFRDYLETEELFSRFDFLDIPVPKSRSRVYRQIESPRRAERRRWFRRMNKK